MRIRSWVMAGVLGLIAATTASCGGSAVETTGLAVEVRAVGLTAGTDLDEVVVTIDNGAPARFLLAAVASGDKVTLPVRFGVVPKSSSSEMVSIDVVGRLGGASKVKSSAQVGFVKNERRLLVIVLYGVCVDKTPACAAANRCVPSATDATKAICAPNKIDVETLPPFVVTDGGAGGSGGKAGSGGAGGGSGGAAGADGGGGGGESVVDGGEDLAPPADAPTTTDTGDAPVEVSPPGCTLAVTRCAAVGDFVETCTADGTWMKKMDCPFLCQAGACTGSCKPTTKHCVNQTPELCSSGGGWEAKTTCAASACVEGACVGTCVPGAKRCGVTNPKQPELCDDHGNWIASGVACSNVCSSGSCGGSCAPGMKRCGSNQTPEHCSDLGTWEPDTRCQFICSGAGNCTGECTPLTRSCDPVATDHARLCSTTGIWQDQGACDNICTGAGNCTGECKPLKRECTPGSLDHPRLCSPAGFWQDQGACQAICTGAGSCTGECKTGQKDCQGVVGGTPRECDSTGHWSAKTACGNLCESGSCTGECRPGTKGCNGKQSRSCDDSGAWHVQTTCTYACQEPAATCATCAAGTTKRCNNSNTNLQLCNSGGTGYDDWTSCPNGCNGARLECNSCTPNNVSCTGSVSSRCRSDGSGSDQTSTCDKQCGYGQCPAGTGSCFHMEDAYVAPYQRPAGFTFCEMRDAAIMIDLPVEGARCTYFDNHLFFHRRQGDLWLPDTKEWFCAGQGSASWRVIDVATQ